MGRPQAGHTRWSDPQNTPSNNACLPQQPRPAPHHLPMRAAAAGCTQISSGERRLARPASHLLPLVVQLFVVDQADHGLPAQRGVEVGLQHNTAGAQAGLWLPSITPQSPRSAELCRCPHNAAQLRGRAALMQEHAIKPCSMQRALQQARSPTPPMSKHPMPTHLEQPLAQHIVGLDVLAQQAHQLVQQLCGKQTRTDDSRAALTASRSSPSATSRALALSPRATSRAAALAVSTVSASTSCHKSTHSAP